MTGDNLEVIAGWSYGIAAAGFAAFAGQLGAGWRGNQRGSMVLAAIVLSAIWSGFTLAFALSGLRAFWVGASIFDVARYGAWYWFIVSALERPNLASDRSGPHETYLPAWIKRSLAVFVALWLATQAFVTAFPNHGAALGRAPQFLPLAGAILGAVLLEQLFRHIPTHARWGFKPLCIGLTGILAFDLYLNAESFLFTRVDTGVWLARGFAHVLVVPFVAISAARNRDWSFDIAVSRRMVFHTSALLMSGLYLMVVAVAGYYLRFFGGSWGNALQAAFVFAALLTFAALLLSGSLRSKLRVYLAKHFFSYRYDYREEWLRITRNLSSHDPHFGIRELSIKALADLVESPAGCLWLKGTAGGYTCAAHWSMPEQVGSEPADGELSAFLRRTEWVVNIDEFQRNPERYDLPRLPDWLLAVPEAWLLVPLKTADDLLGFVVLARARARIKVDWEVNDLLKAAGRQAASFLGQVHAAEALIEARKFEAFNKMSAFVVHDLKNLVAQLSLLLKNAEKHHDNPEFRADMLLTISNVVERMRGLLLQLRAGTTPINQPRPVSLAGVIRSIAESKSAHGTRVTLDLTGDLQAAGHADRLERVIGHLVQNALDATDERGKVWVRLRREGNDAVVEVEDTGHGMSAEFIRDRLFKPFQSTKNSGMGIGAYESSQYVAELGGSILVDSHPGQGTRMTLKLPLTEHSGSETANHKEVA